MGKEAPSPVVEMGESQVEISAPVLSVAPIPSVPQREPPVKSRPKINYADKVVDISMAQGFLPEDKDSLHNVGIPAS